MEELALKPLEPAIPSSGYVPTLEPKQNIRTQILRNLFVDQNFCEVSGVSSISFGITTTEDVTAQFLFFSVVGDNSGGIPSAIQGDIDFLIGGILVYKFILPRTFGSADKLPLLNMLVPLSSEMFIPTGTDIRYRMHSYSGRGATYPCFGITGVLCTNF
jgi:hypothetical protein